MQSVELPEGHGAAVEPPGLNHHYAADEALDTITPAQRAHPDVLKVRYAIAVTARKWLEALEIASALVELTPNCPTWWLHRSYALHRSGRTHKALAELLTVADSFPQDWMLRYNLAQYYCRLGQPNSGWEWLERAFALGDATAIKLTALQDPDLEPVWNNIAFGDNRFAGYEIPATGE